MKLGNIQRPKPFRFLQELVFEGIWPFNGFSAPFNVLLLTLLYFIWGVGIYLFYNISTYFLIAGICAGAGISFWTYGIFNYANGMRNVDIEHINPVKRKFLQQYMDELFHPSSLLIGILLFTLTQTYFFSASFFGSESLLDNVQGELNGTSLPPPLLLYVFLISFDMCYKYGLSAYIVLIQIRRNLKLNQHLRNPHIKSFFTPHDIRELEKADSYHYVALCGGIFFFPMAVLDKYLLLSLFLYLSITAIFSFINTLHLHILYSRAIPEPVLNLLSSSKFAYVGTISSQKIPHVTPTLFVFDGRRLFIATSVKSKKIKNLRKEKNVAFCIDHRSINDFTKSQGVLLQGSARVYGYNWWTGMLFVFVLGLRMLLVRRLYVQKYSEYVSQYAKQSKYLPAPWRLRPIISRTIIQLIPERIIYWKGTKFDRARF
ncbi:MAG: pyridoxamine 5'-phosphate oxidase family protein [Candidatus Hodarchaeota archaeon]